MRLDITITESGIFNFSKRFANKAIKDEMRKIGHTWHDKHRPLHFKNIAYRRYNYTSRSRDYERRKKKSNKTRKPVGPLRFTGKSEDLSKSISRIVAKLDSVTITMPVRAFNYKPRNSQIDMSREFKTIAPVEINQYERQMADGLQKAIAGRKPRKRKVR